MESWSRPSPDPGWRQLDWRPPSRRMPRRRACVVSGSFCDAGGREGHAKLLCALERTEARRNLRLLAGGQRTVELPLYFALLALGIQVLDGNRDARDGHVRRIADGDHEHARTVQPRLRANVLSRVIGQIELHELACRGLADLALRTGRNGVVFLGRTDVVRT